MAMASPHLSTFCSVSLLLGALISAGFQRVEDQRSGNMAMAMAMEEMESRTLLPFGSASGQFIQQPQCGGPHISSDAFEVRNSCPFTVWAAAVPGGGRQLNQNEVWTLSVNPGTTVGRVWGRTNCNFDGSGRGRCETGDCDGLLQCRAYGSPPNTLAEYALNQFNNLNFIDISLVDGFNLPMDFSPTSGGCLGIKCAADINGQCPNKLRAPGGCNNPCNVFGGDQFCCTAPNSNCGPTTYSMFFKNRCPDAYSYPKDYAGSTFTCPGGTKYRIVFCP